MSLGQSSASLSGKAGRGRKPKYPLPDCKLRIVLVISIAYDVIGFQLYSCRVMARRFYARYATLCPARDG